MYTQRRVRAAGYTKADAPHDPPPVTPPPPMPPRVTTGDALGCSALVGTSSRWISLNDRVGGPPSHSPFSVEGTHYTRRQGQRGERGEARGGEGCRGSPATSCPRRGAVPVKNDKGKMSMQKVKVTRYVAGKRPDYARGGVHRGGVLEESSSEGSSDEGEEDDRKRPSRRRPSPSPPRMVDEPELKQEDILSDRRLRRLQEKRIKDEEEEEEGPRRGRRLIAEPEMVEEGGEGPGTESGPGLGRHRVPEGADSGEEEEEDLSEDEIERRREVLRARARQRLVEEEAMAKEEEEEEEEESSAEESSSSEYSSEDETLPRLKPVFVRKRDRVTLAASEAEAERLRVLELEAKRTGEERKRNSAKMVETLVKAEVAMEAQKRVDEAFNLESVETEDEDEEAAYEAWKLRELRRIKRGKEEREAAAKEKAEYERIHAMSEEERRAYLRANPRVITNKAEKGKYKFLQKYYHRGVFYLDEEDDTLKKDFAQPTLEDKFDKSVLPKVMQVKDFGKQGRTKWTHLVQEDTTDFQSAWVTETQGNLKFHTKHAGGSKGSFREASAEEKEIAPVTASLPLFFYCTDKLIQFLPFSLTVFHN